ncbi:MAG: D-2-hydroxyacid dehydrogenase [Ruminococcaceae bacterium]|nr:D-2-hydroxyacid dehydrogenase [Oscillospiraceae bacterium]
MKIVILDHPRENPGEIDWSAFSDYGEVTKYERTLPEEVAERIGDAEIVFLNKTVVTKKELEKCPNVKFISVIATGYNTVDVVGAKELGIPVSNVPSYGTEAIGQHAIALLLEITNHVGYHDQEVRKGRRNNANDWCFWDYSSIELENKTIGIVGLGRIGQITSKVAQAFGMKVLAYDSYKNDALENENCKYTDLDTLLANSDVIALHCPLFPETENIINKDTIAKMKDGVIIINNSRGALIVEEDLAEALNSGKVYAAGLDAVRDEPISMDNPLLSAKNCYITPHISWAAVECRQRLIDYSLDNLKAYLDGNPTNIVNGVN